MTIVQNIKWVCDSCFARSFTYPTWQITEEECLAMGWTYTLKHGHLCPDCRESAPKGVSE